MSEKVLVKYGPEESRKLLLQLKAGENPNYPQGVDDTRILIRTARTSWTRSAVDSLREQKLGLSKMLKKADAAKR